MTFGCNRGSYKLYRTLVKNYIESAVRGYKFINSIAEVTDVVDSIAEVTDVVDNCLLVTMM